MNTEKLLFPINKTAALVTNQKECSTETEYLIVSIAISDIKKAMKSIQELIDNETSKKEKRRLGREKQRLQNMMPALKDKIKTLNKQKSIRLTDLLVKECKKLLTDEQWKLASANAEIAYNREYI